MDILIAGLLYLVVVKVIASLLSSQIGAICQEIERGNELTQKQKTKQVQLTRLRQLRDSAREAETALRRTTSNRRPSTRSGDGVKSFDVK